MAEDSDLVISAGQIGDREGGNPNESMGKEVYFEKDIDCSYLRSEFVYFHIMC